LYGTLQNTSILSHKIFISIPYSFVSRFKGQTENNPWKIKNLPKLSKCYKNQKLTKLPSKKVLSHENRWKNALFIAKLRDLRFFFALDQNFSKFHQFDKKVFWQKQKIRVLWYGMINQIAKFQGFWWTLVPFM
jgi:hypothetical protein